MVSIEVVAQGMTEVKKKSTKKSVTKSRVAAKPNARDKKETEKKAVIFEAPESAPKKEAVVVTGSDKKIQYYSALGRRKEAVASVKLHKNGTGKITVNGKEFTKFFPWLEWQNTVSSPLKAVGQSDKLDVTVNVRGGGLRGQADAVRHGISRALLLFNPVFRRGLKKVGYLTRDPRVKERKKYGLKKARRGPQWAKR